MEKHVTSLEWSKKLKETGWTKNTIYSWVRRWKGSFEEKDEFGDWYLSAASVFSKIDECYPAPLATELLDELPDWVNIVRCPHDRSLEIKFLIYLNDKNFSDKSLPNALAAMWCQMWCHLKENCPEAIEKEGEG